MKYSEINYVCFITASASASGLLVPEGIICLVVSVSAPTRFVICIQGELLVAVGC